MRTQLVATNQKQRNKMMIILVGVIVLLLILLTGCNGKSFEGYYNGMDEQGQSYYIEITKDKLKILQGNQLTEHDYHIEDIKTEDGKKIGTMLAIGKKGHTGADESGTWFSLGEIHKDSDVGKEGKWKYLLGLSRNNLGSLSTVYMNKVDKKDSPISGNSKDGISFFQVLIFGLVGLAVATYMNYMNGRKKLKTQENAK